MSPPVCGNKKIIASQEPDCLVIDFGGWVASMEWRTVWLLGLVGLGERRVVIVLEH